MGSVFFIWCLIGLGAVLPLILIFAFLSIKKQKKVFKILFALSLILLSTLAPIAGLEYAFYEWITPSSGFGFSLAAKRWREKFWRPMNKLRYRDFQHKEQVGTKSYFVVGDSFAAGQGVDDYRDRFSNILHSKLQPDIQVLNVSKPGWGTNEEFQATLRHPIKPDGLILAYFLNDIHGACNSAGIRPRTGGRPKVPQGIFGEVVKESYLINYLYWRVYRYGNSYYGQQYWNSLLDCFQSEKAWELHKKELAQFITYTTEKDISLWVVIFPQLLDIEGSKAMTKKIRDYFISEKIQVLELTPYFAKRDPFTLIANPMDAHPNADVHREVAELIYSSFFSPSNSRQAK